MVYKVTLNGKIYEVDVEKGNAVIQKEYEAALPQAAPTAAPVVSPVAAQAATAPVAQVTPVAAPAQGGGETVKSPLPGNINAVKVTSGQKVTKGTVLIILEAMKMENEIVAPKDGTIGQIFVNKGATVSTGAALIEIV